MYGKLFAQMYDGTLATKGPWEALITFQQLIILADKSGIVDMTAEAIARRTTVPLNIVNKGIARLLEPDTESRTPNEDGRRIVPLSPSRSWGWQIVNYEHYRNLRSAEERREYHRQYYHEKRKPQQVSTLSTDSTKAVSSKHKHKNIPPPSGAFLRFWGGWPKSSRKGERQACWEKWQKNDYDLIADEIISHVEVCKCSADWQKNGGEFIPAPLVYLNKRKWDGAEQSVPSGEVI